MTKEEEKKKRGRKPKNKTQKKNIDDITLQKVPKKRGRKPKNKNQPILSNDKKIKKEKTYTIENFNKTTKNSVNNENIILHLNVHSKELDNPDINSNIPLEIETIGLKDNYANIPQVDFNIDKTCFSNYPFKNVDNNSNELITDNKKILSSNNLEFTEPISWEITNNSKIHHIDNWNINNIDKFSCEENKFFINKELSNLKPYNKKVDFLMKQFKDCNKRNIWPTHTPIHCFWCCHSFNNRPCCLPVGYDNDIFSVYGNFCSPECAASYNFQDYLDSDKKWERYSLLNLLYRKINKNKDLKIKLASPRNTLNIFGGPLTIQNFRSMNDNYEMNYKINYPPLISIIPQIEEELFNNEKIINKDSNIFIPLDEERVENANVSLKLKRSKPLADSKNTLESCMNLQFNK